MSSLHLRMRQALQAEGVCLRGQRIVVAVSGGADSVALLCLLCDLQDEMGFSLVAAHLEHGLRGEASRKDAAFVQALCAKKSVPLHFASAQILRLAKLRGKGVEEAGRFARYRFLELVRKRENAAHIAVAHHRGDQTETLLLHLVRGAGLSGLTGMAVTEGCLLRPLLGEKPETLRAYLTAKGQGWREDATNVDQRYTRNFIRRVLLPDMARLNSDVVGTLYRTASALSVDEAYLQEQLVALQLPGIQHMPYGGCLPMENLAELPAALLRRHLRKALADVGLPLPEHGHLLALESLVRDGGAPLSLNGGVEACRGTAHLHFIKPGARTEEDAEVLIRLDGRTELWLGMWLEARPALPGEKGDGIRTQVLRREALQGAVVRTRRKGDVFSALGQDGHRPLKRVLIDRKVDRMFRGFLPLVASGSDVLWICGHLPAGGAVRSRDDDVGIHLTVKGKWPWEPMV